ncbi:MAG: P-II family nitrogen regulator [Candidatus Omnitrophica bacterium]|nr:P-II family nitrogen regulator [Candidatus Omnitrophota bacterium]
MIEIIAIVRRKQSAATKQELSRIGCQGYTVFPVFGRGKQCGLRGEPEGQGLTFLPKLLFDVVVEDEQAQETVEAITRANQTGQFGDGRIFLIDITESSRLSTGEGQMAKQTTGGPAA